ncbi:MAG: sulfotransferase, partial [Alphaproteobacteria bacterium]|nr:sulfotransferase [Alphaproteobacteria bacterium]
WSAAYLNLGKELVRTRGRAEAESIFLQALKGHPGRAAALSLLGEFYVLQHRRDEAIDCLKRSVKRDPSVAASWTSLVHLLEKGNRVEEALATLKDARKYVSDKNLDLTIIEAKILRRTGQIDEALVRLERCSQAVKTDVHISNHSFSKFFYELGGVYDRLNIVDKAFDCFVLAKNRQQRTPGVMANDKTSISKAIALVREKLEPQIRDASPPLPDGYPAPVFLIGFPRSGTTLLDQILSSHPAVQVAEEKPAVYQMAQYLIKANEQQSKNSPGYASCLLPTKAGDIEEMRRIFLAEHSDHMEIRKDKIFIDKLPLNILRASLIKRVFPDAKFILALRHPCDCVLSCFMQEFEMTRPMARFLDIQDAARFYDEVFGLWEHLTKIMPLNVHAVRYEDIVDDFRPTVAGLLDFLGTGWHDAVLKYDETAHKRKGINTPSYHQVTEKIYTRASGRWLRYREQLKPVLDILEPHARRHGYPAEGFES